MRWALLCTLMLTHLFLPLCLASQTVEARSGELLEYTASNDIYVHQNETASAYITVQNKATENQAFTVTAIDIPAPLSVVGLPSTELLVPNHLKQMAFGIRAPSGAEYQNLTATFSITSDLDASINETVTMDVFIVPRSNLTFGVDDFATFTVDELVRTAVAVNLSNNASFTDEVTFNLYTSSAWAWGWSMTNTSGEEAYVTMAPDTLTYVYLWVDIPAIIDGMPLAETGPRFTLSAVSGLDKAVSTWSFDLLMNEKKNLSIDSLEPSMQVAPNQDGRVTAVVRNVGNTPNTLNITLQGITAEGSPLQGVEASDRFNNSGWVVALFGGLENVILQPNESRVIEIGFQAPNEFQGEMHVELQVFATGAQSIVRTARTVATINRISSGTLSFEATGCQSILPNQTCDVTLSVENTGNSYNTFMLRDGGTTDGFGLTLPPEGLLLQPNQIKTFSLATVRSAANAMAFTIGTSTIELLDDTGRSVDEVAVPLKVAPEIMWTFRNVEEQVNAKGRLSIAMEVRNDGNAVDGLIVQLQSSHAVDMGFIPPDIAVYEEGIEFPRSFEINDIPLNSNFTIRAWVQLPQDQTSNGTVYVNTTIRSRFAPELPFVHTSTGDYLGVQWQPQPEENAGIDWSGMADTAVLYVQAWWGVVASILFAGVILYKAVIDRERRLEENNTLPYQETEQSANDWLSNYEPQPSAAEEPAPVEESVAVPKAAYEAMFRQQNGSSEPQVETVDSSLVSAANDVLGSGSDAPLQQDKARMTVENKVRASDETLLVSEPETAPTPGKNTDAEPIDDLEF